MENEVQIYEAAVKAFEDYCHERKLGYMLQVDSYPLSVSVYQSGELHGQLSMEEDDQPQRPYPLLLVDVLRGADYLPDKK